MRDHYDFTGGVRGKYAARFSGAKVVIVVDGDVPRYLNGRPVASPQAKTRAKAKKRSPSRKPVRRGG